MQSALTHGFARRVARPVYLGHVSLSVRSALESSTLWGALSLRLANPWVNAYAVQENAGRLKRSGANKFICCPVNSLSRRVLRTADKCL